MKQISAVYSTRFENGGQKARTDLWNILVHSWFGRYIKPSDTVMDIGAGYCEFINSVSAARRIAVDINPDSIRKAQQGVEVLSCTANSIPKRFNGAVDVIFLSNFLEHLPTKADVMSVLERCRDVLKKRGTIIILQPNIDLVHERYWDFIDHTVPLNTRSIVEALDITGFTLKECIKRFLPYSTKYSMPQWPWLIRLYLLLPPFIRPFAGQSLFVATYE